MASMLCLRQDGGTCTIHNKSTVHQLSEIEFTKEVRRNEYMTRNSFHSNPKSVSAPLTRNSKIQSMDPKTLVGHALKLQEWLNDKQIKSIQEKADAEARETKKLYETVLDSEDTFVKDIHDFLEYNEMLGYRKKEFLHKQWDKNVYSPIRKEIDKEINGNCYNDLSRRKRGLHKEYLEHTNKKGHVFLDTIAPDEYYPLSLHPVRPSLIIAETNKLQDPLLTQDRARSAEDRVILRCSTGRNFTDADIKAIRLPPLPMVPLGRHGTDCTTWLDMPMGDIESPVRLASRQRMRGNQNSSQFALSDWSKTFHNSVVDEEMQLQRRRKFPMEHMMSQIPKMYSQVSVQDVATQIDGPAFTTNTAEQIQTAA